MDMRFGMLIIQTNIIHIKMQFKFGQQKKQYAHLIRLDKLKRAIRGSLYTGTIYQVQSRIARKLQMEQKDETS